MATQISCSNCNKKYLVGEASLGKKVKCQSCQNTFTAVAGGDSTAGPSLSYSFNVAAGRQTYAIPYPYKVSTGLFSKVSRVKYKCPNCKIKLANKLEEAGGIDSCPECKAKFTIPGSKERAKFVSERESTLERKEAKLDRKNSKRKQKASEKPDWEEGKLSAWLITGVAGFLFVALLGGLCYLFWAPFGELTTVYNEFFSEGTSSGSGSSNSVFVGISIYHLGVYTFLAGLALIGNVLWVVPAIIRLGPIWIIVFLLFDISESNRDPNAPTLIDQFFGFSAKISILGLILVPIGGITMFIGWLFGI